MKFIYGVLATSLFVIAWHVKLQYVVYDLLKHGDATDWKDACKQSTYRFYRTPNEYFNGGKP